MIVTIKLIPAKFDAVTVWPFIFVRKEQLLNTALIEHELVHYREQAWITPFWLLRYFFSKKFRLAAEVRGYKRQIELGGITVKTAAVLLTQYGIGVSYDEAVLALSK